MRLAAFIEIAAAPKVQRAAVGTEVERGVWAVIAV